MVLWYVLPILVWIPLGIYLFHLVRRFLTLLPIRENSRLFKVIPLVFTVFIVFKGWRVYGLWAMLTMHFIVACAVMEAIWAVSKKYLKENRIKKVLLFLYRSCLPGFLVVIFVCSYGYLNIQKVQAARYELKTEKELSKPLKIVQISDLHTGTTMSMEQLKEHCARIQRENPDLIALTGDIFDENTTREQMESVAEILGKIKTTYGIFYVFGNHDYNSYVETPHYTPEELKKELKAQNIHVLEDQVYQVNSEICVAGRKDVQVKRKGIRDVVGDTPKDSFLLLLDHQPEDLKENKKAGVDLQLSGHTHAGQIWPTGQMGALLGITELNYGYQRDGEYQVVVSSGIGGWGYPIRTGGHSEYVVITLDSAM